MIWRILLFVLPFVLYGLWVLYVNRRKRQAAAEGAEGTEGEAATEVGQQEERKAINIAAIGLATLMVFLALWALFGREEARTPYTPPHMEDGQIVPGQVE